MTACVLRFPSRRPSGQDTSCYTEQAAPPRHLIKIVGLDFTVGHGKDALHQFWPRYQGAHRSFDLAHVRLAAAKLASQPFLGCTLTFAPCSELQGSGSRFETGSYCNGLYFVNGHKQFTGAEYKQMTYVLTMHPGNRIRELRKAAGMSQTDLALRSGVSQPYISQIENQDSLSLDIARMRSLARELDVLPVDLLSDRDNPDRLADDERKLLARYRAADSTQRAMIRRVSEPINIRDEADSREAA